MPLQATSGAASYDAFGGGVPVVPNYIEEVFSTHLFTAKGATNTITNNIDLSTKGGLVIFKGRSGAQGGYGWGWFDTVRGVNKSIASNDTAAQLTSTNALTAFRTTGFTLGADDNAVAGNTFYGSASASWTFRKQPKFFDVVTYTGNGALPNQLISHNLGSVPGCIIIKATNSVYNWIVWHRGNGTTNYGGLSLNLTAASAGSISSGDLPTATQFKPGAFFDLDYNNANATGVTYVAYLFAHDAGGFGLTGTDNVISCGSFTSTGSALSINLGYEPQWILFKPSSGAGAWELIDNMRGFQVDRSGATVELQANSSAAEAAYGIVGPTSTGFTFDNGGSGTTYIYIAIRRGPMKVPTTGTSVFSPNVFAAAAGTQITTGFPVDMQFQFYRDGGFSVKALDRLRGVNSTTGTVSTPWLATANTAAEASGANTLSWNNTGFQMPSAWEYNLMSFNNFRRAPSFFDEVCYTGNATAGRTINHNLGVVPELMIVKDRSNVTNWGVWNKDIFAANPANILILQLSNAATSGGGTYFNSTAPTSTVFTVGDASATNGSSGNLVAYLFATCAGVQYINSYVGDGTTGRTINCGFTGGARFVCIKATSTSGSWWTFDSARGIVTNSDPALQLNSTAAEVTSADAIDTASSGFIVNQEATCSLNASGVSYLVWAIA